MTNTRWVFCAAFLGALALTGCVVAPAGGVAYVGPPAVYAAPEPVYVAPAPVYVGPEVVVPVFVGGGGRRR
jgi:hypothetical protein